jgi:UDP-glucuronate decarboxylase
MGEPREAKLKIASISNPREIAIRELAETVIRLTGSSSKLIHLRLPKHDPKQWKPDVIRAREVLGWEPTLDLEDGLKRMVDYFVHLVAIKIEAQKRTVLRTNPRARAPRPMRGPSIQGANVIEATRGGQFRE